MWSADLADAIGATQKKAAVDDRGYSYYRHHATERSLQTHLYLTEQPYGRVSAFETGLPLIDSSSATFT